MRKIQGVLTADLSEFFQICLPDLAIQTDKDILRLLAYVDQTGGLEFLEVVGEGGSRYIVALLDGGARYLVLRSDLLQDFKSPRICQGLRDTRKLPLLHKAIIAQSASFESDRGPEHQIGSPVCGVSTDSAKIGELDLSPSPGRRPRSTQSNPHSCDRVL